MKEGRACKDAPLYNRYLREVKFMEWLSRFMGWASRLETKDLVTIYISITALSFSIISTYITLRQKNYETQRTLRNQLTDVLAKIVSLNLENAKLPTYGPLTPGTPSNIKAFLNDQRRFLVRQVTYIIDQIKPPVGSFECVLIATTYDYIDDVEQAKHYFEMALRRAGDNINRGIVTRSHARFLFSQGEHDSARKLYDGALKFFSGDSDRMKENRGETYYRWAKSEFEWEFSENAEELFEKARENFESKLNRVTRKRSLDRLDYDVKELKATYQTKLEQDMLPGRKQTNGATARAGKGPPPRRKH
jgi:tetratricopeptide (TPR) repeat protein